MLLGEVIPNVKAQSLNNVHYWKDVPHFAIQIPVLRET